MRYTPIGYHDADMREKCSDACVQTGWRCSAVRGVWQYILTALSAELSGPSWMSPSMVASLSPPPGVSPRRVPFNVSTRVSSPSKCPDHPASLDPVTPVPSTSTSQLSPPPDRNSLRGIRELTFYSASLSRHGSYANPCKNDSVQLFVRV